MLKCLFPFQNSKSNTTILYYMFFLSEIVLTDSICYFTDKLADEKYFTFSCED